jgi:hypothetical protein
MESIAKRWIAAAVAMLWLVSAGANGAPPPGEVLPTHFVLLIDASSDINKQHAPSMAAAATQALFDGIADVPAMRPGDVLSVALYGIPGDPETPKNDPRNDRKNGDRKACGEPAFKPNAITAETVFNWLPDLQGVSDRAAFEGKLSDRLGECLGWYNWSPIATADALAVQVAHAHVGTGAPSRFGHLYVYNLSNLAYNHLASTEVHSLARLAERDKGKPHVEPLAETGRGLAEVGRAAAAFRWSADEARRFHWSDGKLARSFSFAAGNADSPFHLLVSEVTPADLPADALIDAPATLRLDRRAVGSDRIEVFEVKNTPPLLTVDETVGGMRARTLQWKLEPLPGGGWPLPGITAPRGEIDLTAPPADQCRRGPGPAGAERIQCNLFALLGFSGCLGPDDAMPQPGRFRFRVVYDYEPDDLYDRLSRRSDWRDVTLDVVPAQRVPAERNPGLGLDFAELELDNAQLLSTYGLNPDAKPSLLSCPAPIALIDADAGAGKNAPAGATLDQSAAVASQLEDRAKRRDAAVRRIKNLKRIQILSAVAGGAGGILLLWLLWLWLRRIPFDPTLIADPGAPEAVIDFNSVVAMQAPVLLGFLLVRNQGRSRRARLWPRWRDRADDQPQRRSMLECVDLPALRALGCEPGLDPATGDPVSILGFIPPASAAAAGAGIVELAPTLGDPHRDDLMLAQGSRVELHIAPAAIADLTTPPDVDEHLLELPVRIRIRWRDGRRVREGKEVCEVPVRLRILRERAVEPLVRFEAGGAEPIEHDFGNDPTSRHRPDDGYRGCGHYVLKSLARHAFAKAHATDLTLLAFRGETPLEGGIGIGPPAAAAGAAVLGTGAPAAPTQTDVYSVPPGAELRVPVVLFCDGSLIPNPSPSQEEYGFRLTGGLAPGSDMDRHIVLLKRDPSRCEVVLTVRRGRHGALYEVFWDARGLPMVIPIDDKGGRGVARSLGHGALELPPLGAPLGFRDDTQPRALLDVHVHNSGRHGDGHIDLAAEAVWDPADLRVQDSLVLRNGRRLEELLRLRCDDARCAGNAPATWRAQARMPEAPLPVPLELRATLDFGVIECIKTGRITDDRSTVVLHINCTVVTDQGETLTRRVELHQPLALEQAPKRDWLCIDFGTSAIAAAVGQPAGNADGSDLIRLLELQQTRQPDGMNLAALDPANVEAGGPFLPSFIVCDADLRRQEKARTGVHPGFPSYWTADPAEPGSAGFIGLPATTEDLRNHSDRVLFALKSWLAQGADALPMPVRMADGSEQSRLLPVERLLRSAFDALMQAYLLPAEATADVGQAVVTCPNTFTAYHRGVLARVARFVLTAALDIPLEERIRLISESDAAAFGYLRRKLRPGFAPPAEQHLLVYDYGAGTVDLSVLRIRWRLVPGELPEIVEWQVRARIGIPAAGNHVDGLLARLIDRLLTDPAIVNGKQVQYRFRLVGGDDVLDADKHRHRAAALNLWRSVRDAKAKWDGAAPLQFHIGIAAREATGSETVGLARPVTVDDDRVLDARTAPPPPDQTNLWRDAERGRYLLQVPAGLVHGDAALCAYFDFIADTLLDECLGIAGLARDAIDNLIVSGRGVQWPGLRERLGAYFGGRVAVEDAAEEPGGRGLKQAVVSGAIARYAGKALALEPADEAWPEYRLLFLPSGRLEPLATDKDETRINWGNVDQRVKVLAVPLRAPCADDLRDPYRRLFYLDASREFQRNEEWADGGDLLVVSDLAPGRPPVPRRLHSTTDPDLVVTIEARAAEPRQVVSTPWPIGRTLLDPH